VQSENICKMDKENITLDVMSFGFKHGYPENADIVFDVRFLQNPFYIEELKPLTGLDERVREYVKQFEETKQFTDKLFDMIDFVVPHYAKKGRESIVIAFGCTGGKHRSVTMAEELALHLKDAGYRVVKHHRDIEKQ